MTPHDALTIPEILTAILRKITQKGFYDSIDDLSEDNDSFRASRRDLLSTALCCTTFKDPSLDVLWSTMDTILPLLKLIPGMQEIHGQMVILGRIDPNQLTVFYSYARRIMHCAIRDVSLIEPSTAAQLLQLEHGLLPSLTSIEVDGDGSASCLHLLPILLPALVRSSSIFSVACYTVETDRHVPLDGFMLALVKHVNIQGLQQLTLSGTLHPEYVSSLSSLVQLQSVSLWLSAESWTFEVIEALSGLPLANLHIDFESANSVPKQGLVRNPFPVLTTLSLTGEKPLILYILDAITGDYLESVVIYEIGVQFRNANAKDQCRFYENFGRFTSLCKIRHCIPECTFKEIHRQTITPVSIIQPLLGLKHLNVLELQFPQPWYKISDRDISDLAFACPLLQKLCIYPVAAPLSTSNILPTSTSLTSLAKSCPNLIEIDTSINMGTLSPYLPPISSHGLQKLVLHGTSVNSPLLTARLLDRLFPNLNTLFLSFDHLGEIGKLLFELCQPVRKDEQWRHYEATIKASDSITTIEDLM